MTIEQYFNNINTRYKTGISAEHSYRSDLQVLLENFVLVFLLSMNHRVLSVALLIISLPEKTFLLAGSIKDAIHRFHVQNKQVKRLVIHFYKTMSEEELSPIMHELNKLGLDIPVIIITVNKNQSKDIVFFDNNFDEKIPLSGTYIPIGNDKYLLCCNSRFPDNQMKPTDGRPLPIKIQIKSKDESIINDPAEIKKLIDQVYQFSRLNWSSVRQSSMPVTLKYPEMIAKIFPHFTGDVIPDFGKQNMWFL